jgi:uncharacterized membrane protein YuzA (DUF378 family)
MDNSALIVGITSLLGVGVYLFLGVKLGTRPVSGESKIPALQFAIFWIALAISSALGGIESLVAAFQTPPLAIVVTFLYYDIALICAALWGLVGYLFYLYRGRSVLIPVSLLYILEYCLVVYYVTAGRADAVVVQQGNVNPVYSVSVNGLLVAIPALLLILPEYVASIAFFTLFFRTKDRTVRYRVTLVSWGLIGWFSFDFLTSALGGGLIGLAVSHVLVVVAALVVFLAYYPPRFVRTRLAVSGI